MRTGKGKAAVALKLEDDINACDFRARQPLKGLLIEAKHACLCRYVIPNSLAPSPNCNFIRKTIANANGRTQDTPLQVYIILCDGRSSSGYSRFEL